MALQGFSLCSEGDQVQPPRSWLTVVSEAVYIQGQRCCHHQLTVLGRPPYRVFSQTAIASQLRHGLQSPLSRKTRLCTAILAPKRPLLLFPASSPLAPPAPQSALVSRREKSPVKVDPSALAAALRLAAPFAPTFQRLPLVALPRFPPLLALHGVDPREHGQARAVLLHVLAHLFVEPLCVRSALLPYGDLDVLLRLEAHPRP